LRKIYDSPSDQSFLIGFCYVSSSALPRGSFISRCIQAVLVVAASAKAAKAMAGALSPWHLPPLTNLSALAALLPRRPMGSWGA